MHYGVLYFNITTKTDRHVSFVFPVGGCLLIMLMILLPWAKIDIRNRYAWLFAFLDPAMFFHIYGALYILVAPDKQSKK